MRKYEQARVLGGGSSINGQMANRGAPTDYDEWEARGAAGWNWNDVLPYFKKVERDLDFDGPLPRQGRPHPGPPHSAGALDRAFAGGRPRPASTPAIQFLPDQNGEFVDGYFPVTHSNQDEQRVSAAMGYLDRETRKRANLTISTDTQVKELLFEGTRCVGVKALVDGREQEFRGREIILSCGAIHSPAHLLRAGIGPVGHLRDMGIPVLMGLRGRRPAPDGSSLDLAVLLRPPRRAHERAHAAPHADGPALFLGAAGRAEGRHVRRRAQQVGLACGRRADRLAAHLRQQDLLRDRPGQARLARSRGTSRSSSSTCCPTGATSTG